MLGTGVVVRAEPGPGGAAVFGSFGTASAAELTRRAVEESLRIATRITLAEVNGRSYHRVISTAYSETEARALVARAIDAGYSAWFLRQSPQQQVQSADEPVNARIAPPTRAAPAIPTTRAPEWTMPQSVRAELEPEPAPERVEAKRPVQQLASARSDAPRIRQRPPETLTLTVSEDPNVKRIAVRRFDSVDIRIDGKVDEQAWNEVRGYDQMLVIDPDTLDKPEFSTVTRMLFTPEGLYVAAVMEQPRETLVARLSGRDEFINRDSFGITLDTSGLGLYGYWFVVNLGGSVMDGKVAPERSFTNQWDGPWQSRTAETEDGWSMELFLPWSMMTMPEASENREMGFWVNRKVAYRDERYSWPALPFGSSRFMSALNKMELPDVRPRQQWAIFPYASSAYDEIGGEDKHRGGVDIFWRPTSNLQVTAAVNPDFGAVESDDVVVNLTAFETFFPEKRLFFLEGNEVFVTSPRGNPRTGSGPRGSGGRSAPSLFNLEPTTLMNTRRIGGAARHVTVPDGVTVAGVERSKPTDLLGAVKLVGQSGGLRYGMLAAFEEDARLSGTDDATGERVRVEAPGREYGVARALYESSGAGRRSIGWIGTMVRNPFDDSITQGIDAHFLSESGKLAVDTQYLYSDVGDVEGHGVFSDISYIPATGVTHRIALDYLDDKLDISDFGFIRQNDVAGARYSYFKSTSRGLPKWLKNSRRGVVTMARANTDGRLTQGGIFIFGTALFNNNSEIRGEIDWFTPRWDDRNSRGNGIFKLEDQWFGFLSYGTSSSKPFAVSVQGGFQGEDRGSTTYFADVGFTWRPMSSLSFDFDYRFRKRDGWLVHQGGRDFTTFEAIDLQPRLAIDYFITARQHLRLTMQWAGIEAKEQRFWRVPLSPGELERRLKDPAEGVDDFTISRLTAQLRYRWEIGPLSDLFVVYTRGSNLENRIESDFDDLFSDALTDPIINVFIIKLRYRFGS